jgi:hypothetical protein
MSNRIVLLVGAVALAAQSVPDLVIAGVAVVDVRNGHCCRIELS